jgi:hypothetical protein
LNVNRRLVPILSIVANLCAPEVQRELTGA